MAAAQDAVAAVRDVLRGTLSVGGEQCLGVVDLPARLARFRAAHPGVEIRLRFEGSAQLMEHLATGRLDVALVAVTGLALRGVDLAPLAAEPLVVLCHPEHALARHQEVDLAGLHGLAFVGFQPDWAARVLADRAFAAAGLPQRAELEVNDVHTLLGLVGHNLGVAIVPRPIAARKQHKLHIAALRGDLPPWQVDAAASQAPSPAARALLAQLRAAGRPGPGPRRPRPGPG